jgi:hypothetical protein
MVEGRAARSGTMLALFAVATILLPFNALPYFKSVFREMANEGAFYPLAVTAVLYAWHLLEGQKIYLPKHSSLAVLAAFVSWVGISGAANFLEIIDSFTKGRTGAEKYIFQYVLLLFVVASSFLVYQLARGDAGFLLKFRRYAAYSLIPVSVYCVVEVLAIFGDAGAMGLLQSVDYFIRDEEIGIAIFRRLRSVSGEPSYFAMYIGFVFPWVFSYLITEEKRRWPYMVLVAYLIGLLLLTFSRSAYGVLGFQILLLMLGAMFHGGRGGGRERSMILLAVATLAAVVIALGAFDVIPLDAVGGVLVSLMDTESITNIGRYGSQAAAFGMAVDNPVFGVGFGQYGFKMPAYVPDWAKISPEIVQWMSSSPDSVWAPALGLYARVAGELGFIGLALWVALWVSLMLFCYRRFKLNSARLGRCDGTGLALLVSLVGILMAGFNSDSLRFFGYWILLGLCWIYLEPVQASGKGGSDPDHPSGQPT